MREKEDAAQRKCKIGNCEKWKMHFPPVGLQFFAAFSFPVPSFLSPHFNRRHPPAVAPPTFQPRGCACGCVQMIHYLLPLKARSEIDRLLTEIQDVQFKLEFEPTTTVEYVEALTLLDEIHERVSCTYSTPSICCWDLLLLLQLLRHSFNGLFSGQPG